MRQDEVPEPVQAAQPGESGRAGAEVLQGHHFTRRGQGRERSERRLQS